MAEIYFGLVLRDTLNHSYHIKLQTKWYFNVKSIQYEPPHDKTNKMTGAPSEDSDQPGHPPV